MNREYTRTDPIIVIIEAIRCKINALSDIYSKTLDAYAALKPEDPLKEKLKEHILKIMDHTLQTMDQFNYALINDDDNTEEEEDIESV